MPKPFSGRELLTLAPRLDEAEQPLESGLAYYQRVQVALPNFPQEVVEQWFYEHSSTIFQNGWLNYRDLCFERYTLTATQLDEPCFNSNPIVAQIRYSHEEHEDCERTSRVVDYVLKNGTWPVPPIILWHPEARVRTDWGALCSTPFHLLEGHHRIAALLLCLQLPTTNKEHDVWLARLAGG